MRRARYIPVTTLPGRPVAPPHRVFTADTRQMPEPVLRALQRDCVRTVTFTGMPAPREPVIEEDDAGLLEDLPTRPIRLAPVREEIPAAPAPSRPGTSRRPAVAFPLGVLLGIAAGAVALVTYNASARPEPGPRAPVGEGVPHRPAVEELTRPPAQGQEVGASAQRARLEPPVEPVAPAPAPRPAPPARWMEVRSQPPGAAVTLDGQVIGYTPLTIMRGLRPGRAMRLERPGFERVDLAVPSRGWARRRGHLEHRVSMRLRQIVEAREGRAS